MEALVSAVLGDLMSRSISFAMDRYYHRSQTGGVEENLQRLHRALLRVQAIVEEAERRRITNQAMLRQLQMMREGMYQGYYMLDSLKHQVTRDEEVSDQSSALSRFNPAKRLCLSACTKNMVPESEEKKKLQKMLASLECILADTKEFVVFLSCYPPLRREPYSTYLWLEKCMFGRQAEQERIINFLLEPEPPGADNFGVLPIIGLARVGKSTLIAHACYDERVRKYFSFIVFFRDNDLVHQRESGVIKHQSLGSAGNSLVVIELVGDVDEGTWRRLLHTLKGGHIAPVSKIIIASRSEKIATFGTTKSLQLEFLHQEAYWCFFKTISFGSTNPEEHPDLVSIGMEIAAETNGSFLAANIVGGLLRGNLYVQFWFKILKCIKDSINMHLLLFGEHPVDLVRKGRPMYFWRIPKTRSVFIAYSCYEVCSTQHDLPMIRAQDIHTGRANPQGKFEALGWRSSIPPYYSYLASCGLQPLSPPMQATKKRSGLRGRANLM